MAQEGVRIVATTPPEADAGHDGQQPDRGHGLQRQLMDVEHEQRYGEAGGHCQRDINPPQGEHEGRHPGSESGARYQHGTIDDGA